MIIRAKATAKFIKERVGTVFLDSLFPPSCPLCKSATKAAHTLCYDCLKDLPNPPDAYCLRCGGDTQKVELGCGKCLGESDYPDRVYFSFTYQEGIAKLLVGYKFADYSEWSRLISEMCWLRLEGDLRWEEPDILLPIPLHPRRFLARRYNQSALIAGEIAKKLKRPLVTNALKRIKMTKPQTHLSKKGRVANVQGAFVADSSIITGRSILLVDDVFTTGATMVSAVSELRRAGAKRVSVLCVARTIKN
ncbi:MAG: ComF family protein [Magnetococcales bacterium]|nr:ComF family protein [Magnetococcales bacterium]